MSETQPTAGDTIRVRSPEAHATANPTFVLPGGHMETRPALVKCPKCGKRNLEPATFDCQGDCGRQNLCERHFDEEFKVCIDCARTLRGEAKVEAERLATLQADLASWRQRAEQAEARVAELTHQGEQAQRALERAQAELRQAQERVHSLEQEMVAQQRHAKQAEASVDALTKRSEQTEIDLAQRTTALSQSQERVKALERDLASWRSRAEKAEGELAAIVRASQETNARKPLPVESPRPLAEEAKRQQPAIWQQIGIDLVRIPAGEFLYSDEKRRVHLPEYWIAKMPVTNLQYKAFVDATRAPIPSHWTGGRIPRGKENHPVVNVSWGDTRAFCQWAGLCLPTEQEWEKAARGIDGREYPWGNQAPNVQRCNFGQNIRDTTPVGKYPAGASPYGLMDMAGNVWEWCEDWQNTEHKYRVLRGGSWNGGAQRVRVAFRDYNSAGFRRDFVGFRCARSS